MRDLEIWFGGSTYKMCTVLHEDKDGYMIVMDEDQIEHVAIPAMGHNRALSSLELYSYVRYAREGKP